MRILLHFTADCVCCCRRFTNENEQAKEILITTDLPILPSSYQNSRKFTWQKSNRSLMENRNECLDSKRLSFAMVESLEALSLACLFRWDEIMAHCAWMESIPRSNIFLDKPIDARWQRDIRQSAEDYSVHSSCSYFNLSNFIPSSRMRSPNTNSFWQPPQPVWAGSYDNSPNIG